MGEAALQKALLQSSLWEGDASRPVFLLVEEPRTGCLLLWDVEPFIILVAKFGGGGRLERD